MPTESPVLSPKTKQWYQKSPDLQNIEIQAMLDFKPDAMYDFLSNGKMYWIIRLQPIICETRKDWTLIMVYDDDHPQARYGSSVKVYPVKPNTDEMQEMINKSEIIPKEFSHIPHILRDSEGSYYLDVLPAYQPQIMTAAVCLRHAMRWITFFELGLIDSIAWAKFTGYSEINQPDSKDALASIDIPVAYSKQQNTKLKQLLAELDSLTGLKKVKYEVTSIINQIKIRKAREAKGLKITDRSNHLVFKGNPGTGKTTVARILADIYCELGLLSKGHLIETDRSGLIGAYIGQTEQKTREIAEKAMGGILFIDEAYSLSQENGNDFGKLAIDTLLKIMEDKRDDFIVIVAGYTNEMETFIKINPGLESRFNNFIDFDDYNGEELYDIFMGMCKKYDYAIDSKAIEPLKQYFLFLYKNRSSNYANARNVRNFYEKALKRQENRIASYSDLQHEELIMLTMGDLFSEETVEDRTIEVAL